MATADSTVVQLSDRMKLVSAPPEQIKKIEAFSQLLDAMAHQQGRRESRCQLVGPDGESIPIPETVFSLLERVTEVLARGDAITVVPVGKELTTQQAANILNVSRQYLVRLLDQGRIPHTKTGKHRRIRVGDVLVFKRKRDRSRRAALDELTELSEELGGYSELR